MNLLEVRESAINGKGVFALQDIVKNTKIQDYKGVELTYKEFFSKYTDTSYCYNMNRINKIIVAKESPYNTMNISHYMNESKDPNIIFKKRAVYTLKDIKQGEECFLKYPFNYKRNYKL